MVQTWSGASGGSSCMHPRTRFLLVTALATAPCPRRVCPPADFSDFEDDSDDGAGLEIRAEQSSELAPEVQEIIGQKMFPLKRKKCRNLDKEDAEQARRDEAHRMEEL